MSRKLTNDRPHLLRQGSLPQGPRHFLFPCVSLTHPLSRPCPPSAMPTAAPSLGWAMGVHRTGDSGAYLELKSKGGETIKKNLGADDLRMGEGSGGRGRVARAAQVTQVLYSHLSHFLLPPSHSHSVRGSWGLWFLFCLGTRSGSAEGLVRALASHFRVINASLRGRRGWIGGSSAHSLICSHSCETKLGPALYCGYLCLPPTLL